MDIVEVARRHGPFLERLIAKSTGFIGELLVADALTERGYRVVPTNNNARQADLSITAPSGLTFRAEVKADRATRPTWFVRSCPDASASSVWFLVSAPRLPAALPDPAAAQVFVLTAEEACAIWQASEWNRRNPTNGDIRRWQVPDDALNAWDKLPR
ncbi:hypothetical protein AB6806_09085 [Bosea sp. RCC_152_1]|uniref:hypothetical protein n=1 Tax=Bosea sp. RCC_152_1 TaxID=3239228 RepID=UPI003524D424